MEILRITLLIPLVGATIIALFAALNLLLPAEIEKTRKNLENSLGRSLLLGVVNFIFFAVLALATFWLSEQTSGLLAGIFIFLAGIIATGMTIFSLLGLTTFANILGERIGNAKTPFISDLRGGTLFLLAALAPYIGWFLFLPLMLWTGFGAAISALIRRKKATQVTEE